MEDLLSQTVRLWAENENIPRSSVEIVAEMPGGTVNTSFLARHAGADYVVRLRSPLANLISRSWDNEIYAAQLAAAAGIAPQIVFSNDDLAVTVSRYAGAVEAGGLSKRQISELANRLAQLHRVDLDHQCLTIQNYRQLASTYFELASKNSSSTSDLVDILDEALDLARLFDERPKCCFTHHDLTRGNVLWQNGRVLFVDWEYACIGDPDFDLAVVVDSFGLSSEQTQYLLAEYLDFGGVTSSGAEDLAAKARFVLLLEQLWSAAVFG